MSTRPVRLDGVDRYILALVLPAAAVIAVAIAGTSWSGVDTPSVLALVAIGVLSVFVPVRYFHASGVQGYQLEGAAFVALLLVGDPGVAVVAASAGALVAFGIRTRSVRKTVFNAAQNALWAGPAALAFTAVGPAGALLSARTALAVGVAGVTMTVCNALLVGELVHRLDGTPRRAAVSDATPLLSATLIGNATAGYALGVLVTESAWGALLGALLLFGLHLGYRGHLAGISDKRRAERLHDVTRTLLEASTEFEAIDRFVDDVRSLLGANGAEVGVIVDGALLGARIDADGRTAVEDVCPDLRLAMTERRPLRLGAPGSPDTLAVPLIRSGEVVGGIAVFGRRGIEPWTEADLHLLGSVANEATVALENVELFRALDHERARLEAESTKLGDIVNAASDGIVLLGRDGRVQAWNDAMAEMSGTPREEALGHPWFVALRIKDAQDVELLPEGEHVVAEALDGYRHREAVALQLLRRDGRWRWLRVTFAPVLREDAEPIGTVLVARDVTTEREVEELKSDFVATVSHELRTPLTPLKGFLATLDQRADTMDADRRRTVHAAMRTQVDRLEGLIADLLVIADLDRGAVTLERVNLDLRAIAEEVTADADGGRVRVEAGEPVTVVGDPDATRRVVAALVSNACKHTSGSVVVRVSGSGDDAVLDVDDEGAGIPLWEQERIFQRFHRLGDHLTRTQGPGLGLPIARALAQRMGGDVTVTSDVDGGSRFTLRLRRAHLRVVDEDAVTAS